MVNPVIGPIYSALTSIWYSFIAALPGIIAAIILLFLGFGIGKMLGTAIKRVLEKFNVDKYVVIKHDELKLSNLFSEVTKWVIYLLFISQAAEAVGIYLISEAVLGIVRFLPHVLASIIIVAVGYVIARYVEDIVRDSKFAYSGVMSKVFFFFIVYLAIAIGLNALNTPTTQIIDPSLINNILLIIVGSAGLGFAIAMGLGLKDMFKEISHDLGRELTKSLRAKRR
jgi:hypothetical protein